MKIKSQDIKLFPFEQYSELEDGEVELLAKEQQLTNFNSWMLPQIKAHYGNWKLHWVKDRVDPQLTAKQNIQSNWDIGLWRVVTKLKRGLLVKQQIAPEGVNSSQLVPIILAGVKQFQGVGYTRWILDEHCKLIHKPLLDAILYARENPDCCNLGSEKVLEIRDQGLTVKSGANYGKQLSPISTWTLRGVKDTEFAELPPLLMTMLAQIWVAHPQLRTNLMILDPIDLDSMPEPLIKLDLFENTPQEKQTSKIETLRKIDMPF